MRDDLADCRAMELMCRARANSDPVRGAKWLGQAGRWAELAKREAAWRFQRRGTQQQMHADPMGMGPNPVGGGIGDSEGPHKPRERLSEISFSIIIF
jgi:hypothetical protein